MWRTGLRVGVRLCRGAGSDDAGKVDLEVGPSLRHFLWREELLMRNCDPCFGSVESLQKKPLAQRAVMVDYCLPLCM